MCDTPLALPDESLSRTHLLINVISGNRHLTVFNDQASVQVGGMWSSHRGHGDRPFVGVIAGVLYNGLRPLDMAAQDKNSRVIVEGEVKLLESIPFDFKERHPEYFTKEAMRTMMDKVYANRGDSLTTGA